MRYCPATISPSRPWYECPVVSTSAAIRFARAGASTIPMNLSGIGAGGGGPGGAVGTVRDNLGRRACDRWRRCLRFETEKVSLVLVRLRSLGLEVPKVHVGSGGRSRGRVGPRRPPTCVRRRNRVHRTWCRPTVTARYSTKASTTRAIAESDLLLPLSRHSAPSGSTRTTRARRRAARWDPPVPA